MIGRLLKQLFLALGRYIGFHTGRILHSSDRDEAQPSAPAALTAGASNADKQTTATADSISNLSDEIGLDREYERPIPWPCYRAEAPPAAVTANALYKLWAAIPNGFKWTHYFPVYEAVFGPLRSAPLRILEIGIWKGASVQLWRQYFDNPETIVVGVDLLPECIRFDAPESGVHVRIGSQADAAFLKQVLIEFGPFDLIIDDGSHHSSHIITSFNLLYDDGLKDDGIYFVEDLHANYWHPWRDSKKSFLDICKELMEHMHAHYRGATPEDFLIDTPSTRPTTEIKVPRIATMIKEIRIFDSMVAIYKARLDYVPYFLRSEQ